MRILVPLLFVGTAHTAPRRRGEPRAKPAVLLAVLALGLAGCIGPAATTDDLLSSAAPVSFLATPSSPATWTGKDIVAEDTDYEWTPACFVTGCDFPAPDCGDANCERIPFTVELPQGFWDEHDGSVEVSILWENPADDWNWFHLRVLDEAGKVVAEADGGIGEVALLEEASPGDYVAEIVAYNGEGSYEGLVELEAWSADVETHDLLPDLVVLEPTNVHIEKESQQKTLLAPAGVEGCSPYEAVEGGARRCLRFANRVGNIGEGPFEVHLTVPEGVKAAAGLGRHVQYVHASDGTTRIVDVGAATFHATHTHFHYEGLNAFAVYEYDLDTKTRGALVNTGHKGGVCLVNSGLIALGLPHTAAPDDDATCFYPAFAPFFLLWGGDAPEEWSMVLSSNWYDLYGAGLDDMYVDMSGAADGVYELVSTANADGSAVEADLTNNEASVVFRLTGDDVEMLG